MLSRRLSQPIALMALGEGVMAVRHPRRLAPLWEGGPSPFGAGEAWRARHPGSTRAIGAAEAAAGLGLAARPLPGPRSD
ncbi:hypothetical protein [Tautonia sociabilis]|uniref:Uncharacterized protein n=1 Tax=Tautonia sociabilis TaxID=2080755 RepID=A0A432ML81_9BACT|nr:hypothetical protein [Tautonia sociabilis]RUL87895.1 hypothetical protein TsocGM_10240 [Tautonia sociabilis]